MFYETDKMEPMDRPDLSLVIACYNEAPHLEDSVTKILRILQTAGLKYEIIFVDDASRDGTRDIIQRLSSSNQAMSYLFHSENMGRGRAVSDGIRRSAGRVVGFIDIDLETDAKYIPVLFREIIGGADIACGRRIYKVTPGSAHRWMLNRGYNFLVRHFLGLGFYDTETGCKFFDRERILPILEDVRDNHWFWDTEIIARAYLSGLKIVEVPTLYVRRKDKKSTVRIVPDVIYYLKKMLWFKREMAQKYTKPQIARAGGFDTEKSIRAYWEENAEYFDRFYAEKGGVRGFFVRAFLKERMAKILSAMDVSAGKKVLDIGCGSGIFIEALSKMGAEVTGVDCSKKMLSLADCRLKKASAARYDLLVADASSLPVGGTHYDFVICAGLLDYVLDIKKVLKEIHRVLKDSGLAVITIPSRITPFFILRSKFGGYLRKKLFNLPPILSAVTKVEMLKILDGLGFKTENVSRVAFTMWIFSIRRGSA